jgi:glyoxylase I family protein
MGIPLKVAELDHVVFRCRDQNRVYDFYTRVLGLTEERRLEQIGLIQLRAGSGLIDLVPATGQRADDAGLNVDHVCLGVETRDLNEVVAYLRGQAVEVLSAPVMRYGARGDGLSIYVKDPEGNVVELKQIPAAS